MSTTRNAFTALRWLVGGILIGIPALSHAQLTQMLYSPPASPTYRDNYTGGTGCKFEVGSSNVIVSHLGFFSTNNTTGLATNHYVGVYAAVSGTPLLGQVIVPAGVSAYYTNNFYWMPLNPPLLLASNTSYYVAALPYSGDGDSWGDSATVTFNPWFVGTQAASTQSSAYGPGGNTSWPIPGFSTFGSSTSYSIEGLGYIQVGSALVGVQQTNVAASAGQTLTVNGFASGQAPITYQWHLASGALVPNQTNATLAIANAATTNSGTYYLTASNSLGGAQSSNVVVSVTSIPVGLSQQPTNTTVFQNYTATFSVTATGTPPISYQWSSNGVAIPGATANTYSLVASPANNGEVISVLASNYTSSVSYTTNSSNAVLTVIPNLAQPQEFLHGFNNKLGNNTYGGQQGGQFVTGNGLVLVTHLGFYAWPANTTTNGANISCVLTNTGHNVGLYNANGSVLLGSVLVPVGTNPVINGYMWQPLNPPLVLSNNTQYLLEAQTTTSGDPWGDTYILPDLNSYFATSCDATYGGTGWGSAPSVNGGYPGQMYSAPNLAILAPATPEAVVLPAGGFTTNAGFSTQLTAIVAGQAPITIQWYEEPGVLLTNQTNLTLNLPNLAVSNSGSYYIIATNNVTHVSTQSADVIVTITPDVGPYTTQDIAPYAPVVVAGSSVTFSAVFAGSPSFTYGWQFDGNAVSNSARISGANGNVLTINDVQSSDAGTYQLFATNAVSYGVSSAAILTVVPFLPFNNGIGMSSQGNTIFWPNSNVVALTESIGNESNSVFSTSQLYIGAFEASFSYQCTGFGNLADGVAFCIQDDPRGSAAIGGAGGALGVGTPTTITPSVEFEINIYAGDGIGGVGVSFNTNGMIGPVLTTTNVNPPLNLTNGDFIHTLLTYQNGILSVTMVDTNVSPVAVFSASTNLNIPKILGTNIAYVGFTGSDGGAKAFQQISNFVFVSQLPLSTQASGSNVVLSWPASSGSYVLMRSSSIGPSAKWTPVAATPSFVNGGNQVSVPISNTNSFYELVLTNVPNF